MALELRDIRYAYFTGESAPGSPALNALDGVALTLQPAELVLVVGATGSGKSTLLRLAAGLLPVQAGIAEIDGEPLTAASARGRVGICFQSPESQLFAETVLADAAFGPRNLGATPEAAEAAARDALDAVGLPADVWGSRSPFGLSGGEARRAALAGVLAMRPRYLLLDEPTAGLDARGRALVRTAVQHARERAGVAVVTHDAAEFLGEADRVLVLECGASRYWGSASDVMGDPSPLEEAGLGVPELLRVRQLAQARGVDAGSPTLDPALLADALVRAGGWRV